MNRSTAREMLAFLISNPKRQPEKSPPPQIATTRDIPISKRSESKEKSNRKYFQHRVRPIDPI
jgi:hypothetical protein